MKVDPARYTSGRIALANLSSSIEALERSRLDVARPADLVSLAEHLFLRGDVLGRIADHDRAEVISATAASLFPTDPTVTLLRARVAERFHRFEEAHGLLDEVPSTDRSDRQSLALRASLLQATGKYWEALALRERLAKEERGIDTLGALATLSVEMGQWAMAEILYIEALEVDDGLSPLPCAQLLFEWGVGAMRQGALDRAEDIFAQLEVILPGHVPGRGHRAEVALARGNLDAAATLIQPLLASSDDPEYVATHAEILAARGNRIAARIEALRAAEGYTSLLERRPEAYADHAAAFFMGVGDDPLRAVELAAYNRAMRDTPRSRALLAKAQKVAQRRKTHRASGWILEPARGLP
jgi:tetratricopeptide (TPR) repeat protein